ncbi:hypothetical protein C5167_014604 [Papaver somniferum]|uniref:Uncharacterized protein n=1 Tax=Papaver somniferum TaxID=3469 RepID=A0A4Y7J3N3_PAPSO|nr:hypothetical protein C5167_014604 [Papaver somniferum]
MAITKPVTDECAFIEENAGFIFGKLAVEVSRLASIKVERQTGGIIS